MSGWQSCPVPIPTLDLFCAFSFLRRYWNSAPGPGCEITLSLFVLDPGGIEGNLGNSRSESSWQHRQGAGIYRAAWQLSLLYKLRSKSACLGLFFLHRIEGADFGLLMLLAKRGWFYFGWYSDWFRGAGQCRKGLMQKKEKLWQNFVDLSFRLHFWRLTCRRNGDEYRKISRGRSGEEQYLGADSLLRVDCQWEPEPESSPERAVSCPRSLPCLISHFTEHVKQW